MLSFITTTDNNPDFHLEKLEIGWNDDAMGFMAALGFGIESLPELLAHIGFDLPKDHGLQKNQVDIVLAYERVKSGKDDKADPAPPQSSYAYFAKITIAGPLKLSDMIDTGDFKGLPELDKVELVLEIDTSTTKEQSAKDALIGFKMYFSRDGKPGTTIIEAVYEKETISDKPKTTADLADAPQTTVNKRFRAVMYSPGGGDSVELDFAPYVPIQLHIKDLFVLQTSSTVTPKAQLALPKATTGSDTPDEPTDKGTTLFGLDLDLKAELELSKLPVVGKDLADTKLSFKAFRVLYSKNDIKQGGLNAVNDLLKVMQVPTVEVQKSDQDKGSENSIGLKKGFSFSGKIQLGDDTYELFSGSKPKDGGDKLTNEDVPESAAQTEKPTQVGKKYGPVTIRSMNLGLKKGFHLDLSGSLELGPLELDLMGFSMDFPIQKLLPPHQDQADDEGFKMAIQGLNLRYHKPPLTIDGGFLKQPDETKGVTYSGELAIGLKAFQLTAFGSFGEAHIENDKYKTFFIYGFLSTPPLGPPFLQLTGVAMGFGYNRQVVLPAPEYIDLHPLVAPVLGEGIADFDKMNEDIPPSKGDFWAALGVRVESFKMINAFVLAILKFGHELEIDLLGRVSLVLPKNAGGAATPALAKLDIGIVATILPERGVVAINGRVLPGSYIFEPSAALSGGFAVLVIAKDQDSGQWQGGKAGDFVLSFGGYSPFYTPKTYYPQNIPRMALNWQPYSNLDVSANTYFTIVPEAFMFGGYLSVNFNAGGEFSIFVHFDAGLDFIVWWQPKRYIGHAYANLHVGARVWFVKWHNVEFDLSADIAFWGPPFAGHASVKVHVLVTFTVGIDFGPAQQAPTPISWGDFQQTLLPETGKVVSAALTNGLLGKIETDKKTICLVNPKEMAVDITSAFPVKNIRVNDNPAGDSAKMADFGIAPMAINDVGSDLKVTITQNGKSFDDFLSHFAVETSTKNYPAAIWQHVTLPGTVPPPPPKGENLMDLCGGITLKAHAPTQGAVFSIPSDQFDMIDMPAASWTAGEFAYPS